MKKAIFAILSILIVFLVLPLYVDHACSPAGKEGWYFTMFLMIDPIFVALLGIFAGSDLKRLWFAPVLGALIFAPGFWLSTLAVDTSVLVYAPIYLVIGAVAMGISELFFDRTAKKKTE
ncbi:MAG: hypothetical protein IJX39_10610 [Clostridia bacterium]|nr:hypothetical protein [Clostridia bacterium]